jgi:ABC-2 type transport system ATP-binding protein
MIINKGKIVADGTAKELRKQAQGKEVLQVSIEDGETNEVFEALKNLPSTHLVDLVKGKKNSFEIQSKANESSRRAIFDLCVKKKWALVEMAVFETKLEDVFRELTMN